MDGSIVVFIVTPIVIPVILAIAIALPFIAGRDTTRKRATGAAPKRRLASRRATSGAAGRGR
jgi:hypothetical protein